MVPLSDLKLIELIQDPLTKDRGFQLLMDYYQKRVYGIIRKMLIVHEDSDDVLQNTFIKAFRNIHKFNRKSTLFTWLYRIVRNRQSSRRQHLRK